MMRTENCMGIIFHSVLAIVIVCVPLGLCTVQCIEAYINVVNITQPSVSTEQQLEYQLQKKLNLKLRKTKVNYDSNHHSISI